MVVIPWPEAMQRWKVIDNEDPLDIVYYSRTYVTLR